MKTYGYEAVSDAGVLCRGQLHADNEQALQQLIEQRGLTLVRLKPFREAGAKGKSAGHVPARDLIEFARYVALTTQAGLPLVDCIDDFATNARSPAMRKTLARVGAEVRGGAPLADSFARYPQAFDATFVSMIRAGESSGTLDSSMRRAADQMEFQSLVRGQVKAALIPPAILIVALTGLVILLLTFLLPRLMESLSGGNVVLPLPTRIVLAVSDFLRGNAVVLCSLVGGGLLALRLAALSTRGRLRMNALIMKAPVIGPLMRMTAEARFASTMAGLLSSGVDAVRSLQMAAESTGAPALRLELLATAERVREGQTLTEALAPVKGMHPLLLRMLQLGEKTGHLDETLSQAAEYYAGEIPRGVKRALQILEPAIVIGAGGTVAFIVLATILPIFSLYDSIG